MIISAGNRETFSFARSVGVGLVEVAINLTRIALFERPKSFIFVGSAGSYGNLKPFDIIKTHTASNIENSFLMKKSYTPINNFLTSVEDKEIVVNSSNYITTDEILSKAYLKFGIDAENMEFFAVMQVAKEFNIPVEGVFVVTNYCYKNAHNEYLENIEKANKVLVNYLKNKGYII